MDERVRELYQIMIKRKESRDIMGKSLREEVIRQLKEEEKEQRQDKYVLGLQEAIEEVLQLAAGMECEQIREGVKGIVDEVERMAFMEGYIYAVEVLEEGLVNMK